MEQGTYFTPKLQAGGASGLANGTLVGYTDGDDARIDLCVGHRTTFDADAPIRFQMPDGITPEDCTGRVFALDVSCNQAHWGTARVEGGAMHLYAEDGSTWTPYVPFTLAPGDTIQIVLLARPGCVGRERSAR
jgi:hypothetical protein